MNLNKNVRIQLYNSKGMVSERLVQQVGEFYNGPKDKHKGPFRIEFTLETQEEIEGAIDYLKQLALDAPLKSSTTKASGAKVSKKEDTLDNSLEVLLEDAKKAAKGDQDKFIKYLRDHDFVFLDSDLLKLSIPETYEIKKRHLETYQWLIRRSRIAKDPRNDKYDPQLLIGVVIFGERQKKMVLYMYSELKKSLFIEPPEDKAMDFSKTNLIKYPHWMKEDERFKWGVEHRIYLNNPEKPFSKFYVRWMKDVKVGDELKIKNRN